ncbi:MAG: Rho termination factor N-terminal domain-containing protein, partial [Actinomycetota bacterium]|nr:Rho termination factor N-terminal domain-containing protein [Actinomycetota bacterium]
MLLPELKQLAGGLGIKGAGTMRKGQLIEAIQAAQGGAPKPAEKAPDKTAEKTAGGGSKAERNRSGDAVPSRSEEPREERSDRQDRDHRDENRDDRGQQDRAKRDDNRDNRDDRGQQDRGNRDDNRDSRRRDN